MFAEQEVFGMHIPDLDSLKKVFDEFDDDNSGTIDAAELQRALVSP